MVVLNMPEYRVLRDYAEPGATRRMHSHDDATWHVFTLVTGQLKLTIEGEVSIQTPEGLAASYAEVGLPRYRRVFTLSKELDAGKVTAELSHGVLKLRIPKAEHAKPRGVPIPKGTLLVVDAGCAVDGYASDCTRTFFTGEPTGRLREVYDLCLAAQLDGLVAVRPGASGREVDAASRVAIGEAGMGDLYGHGLGHGVGLEVHELPTLRPESDSVLVAGNVVTVEPGLYLPGEVGVRIEDLVVVTEDGCERLTTVTKEPVQVG